MIKISANENNVVVLNWNVKQGEYGKKACVQLDEIYGDCDAVIVNFKILGTSTVYESQVENNKINLPFFSTMGMVEVGVYGYQMIDEVLTLRHSPTPVTVFVDKGSYKEGEQPPTPTPGTFEELLNKINTVETGLANKVDKVEGKGLSTNDYNDEEKALVHSALQEHQDISGKADISDLAAVAFSGSYNDLTDKPRTFKAEEHLPENPEVNDICVLYKKTVEPVCNGLFVKNDIDSQDIVFYKPNYSTTIKGDVSIPEFTVTEQKGIQILDGLTGKSDYIMVFLLPASEEISKSVINVTLFQYDNVHHTYREAKEYYYAQNGTLFVGEILPQGWYEMVDDELTPIEKETIESLSMSYVLDVYEMEEGEHEFSPLTDVEKNVINSFVTVIKFNGVYVNTVNGWRGVGGTTIGGVTGV